MAVAAIVMWLLFLLGYVFGAYPLISGPVALGIALVALIAWRLGVFLKGRKIRRSNTSPLPSPEPNLVWEYLKAKKRKLCPLISVEEVLVVRKTRGET
jgi:apolipoprotein N-acyltransferase